jgi:hypothetical protein
VRPETDAELARRAVLDSAGEDDWGLWEIFGTTTPADLAVLDTRAAWEPAGEQPSYLGPRITPAGEEAYYAMLREDSGSTQG